MNKIFPSVGSFKNKGIFWIFMLTCFAIAHVQCRSDSNKNTLRLVEVLFRHGDRAPTFLYPNDPNDEHIWPEGLGMLTMLGRKQQYALGKFLRYMYRDFVTSNPNEVTVNSTDADRCLRSAQCNIASFYAPSPEWKFDPEIPWQPIPIQSTPRRIDKSLNHESDCPAAFAEQARVTMSPTCRQLMKDHKDLVEILSYHSGMDLHSTADVDDLHNILFIEKRYNLIVPRWVDPLWDELHEFARKSLLCKYPTRLIQRLRSGPFLGCLSKDFKNKAAGKLPELKVRVHSAHEHNIKIILSALKVFNMQQPPYCATIIFELHELNPDQHAVRLLYLNATRPEDGFQVPNILTLEGCSEYCPLDYFLKYTKNFIPNNWEEECGLKKKD